MKEEKRLLYITMEAGRRAKTRLFEKYVQSCHECKIRKKTRFVLFHASVPEFYFRNWIWRPEKLHQELEQVIRAAKPDDVLLHPQVMNQLGITDYGQNLTPEYVYQFMLRSKKGFHDVAVKLPADGKEEDFTQLVNLLDPYLPRCNTVHAVGSEDWLFEELEDYLYYEYGIILQITKKPPKNIFLIDLWSCSPESGGGYKTGAWTGNAVTYGESLKFLDTMVKNGYNTES